MSICICGAVRVTAASKLQPPLHLFYTLVVGKQELVQTSKEIPHPQSSCQAEDLGCRGSSSSTPHSVAPPTHVPPPPPTQGPTKQLPSNVYCAEARAGILAMPKNALVVLRYGPYSSVGLPVEHRTYRLEGLLGKQLSIEGPPSVWVQEHPSFWASVQAVPSA